MTGTELRAYRESVPMSIHRLAHQLGVHFTAVSHWEHGRRPIPSWVHQLLTDPPPPAYWVTTPPILHLL